MKMRNNTTELYKITNWRTYLDPTDNTRVETFLHSRGKVVLTGLMDSIELAINQKLEKILVLVHPNVSKLIMITEIEYEEVLEYCLGYFQEKEEYELCADTLRVLKKVRGNTKKKK